MEDGHVWCANAAPWVLFPWDDQPVEVTPLQETVEADDCRVIDAHGDVAGTDIRWFGDSETCEGLRVFGIENAGSYRVACAGLGDTGVDDPHATPFKFEVGADLCPVVALEGASLGAEEYTQGEWSLNFSLPSLGDEFFAAGGLIRVTSSSTSLKGYLPMIELEGYCENVGPTLTLQLLQPDGGESEAVVLDMPCDEVETGCGSTGRRAPIWMALFGLPMVLVRRARWVSAWSGYPRPRATP